MSLTTVCGGMTMVSVAPVGWLAAPGESTMLVTHSQRAAQVFAGPIPVNRERRASDRMRHDAIPPGRRPEQPPRGSGVDGP